MSTRGNLRIADARAAIDLAAQLAVCADAGRLATHLERLGDLIGAEGMLLTASHNWMNQLVVEVGDQEIYRPELLAAVGAHWSEHPLLTLDLGRPRAEARTVSDLVTREEWRRGGLFDDFYRPLGMVNELSVQLAWGPSGSSCCLALHRGGRDYDERDREFLDLLAPHLRAARTRAMAERPAVPSAAELADRLPLTAREAEVLAALVDGRTNDGIAHELGISRHTVNRHVEHIYTKLGVRGRAAATRVALGG